MLLSNSCKFIFIKTRKTASTSIEGLLEKYCTPPGHIPSHKQGEIISEYGYVAGRAGGETNNDFLPAHASANMIRNKIGDDIFNNYTKIYSVRNPYDKVVSWFWHIMPNDIKSKIENNFDLTRFYFSNWLRMRPELNTDIHYYKINNIIFDADIIRYESLNKDLLKLSKKLDLELEPSDIPQWKRNSKRHHNKHFMEYYDSNTKHIVYNKFSFDFKTFNYNKEI